MRSPARTTLFVLVSLAAVGAAATRAAGGPPNLPQDPPTEFRGVFVTTAYSIDWPSKPGLHHMVQEDEIQAIVERASKLNLNVIILQVRAFGDRIHRTPRPAEPWSAAVRRPDKAHDYDPDSHGTYDPLGVWISACHAKGIELHAWVNPFRVDRLITTGQPTPTTLPALPTDDGQHMYLDPTYESVQNYVLDATGDLINYRPQAAAVNSEYQGIDGVLFDHDLPYDTSGRITTAVRPCGNPATHPANSRIGWLLRKAGPRPPNPTPSTLAGFMEKACKQANGGKVKFGISPCCDDETWGMTWLKAGYANYVIPELYSKRSSKPFKPTLDKWLDAVGQQAGFTPIVVAGLFTARIQSPPDNSNDRWPAQEIKDQIKDAKSPHSTKAALSARGQAHYSWSALRSREHGGPPEKLGDDLAEDPALYAKPALVPSCTSAPAGVLGAPQNVKLVPHAGAKTASWEPATGSSDVLFWAVWLRKANAADWEPMQVIDRRSMEVPADTEWVAVKAIDRYNRLSDFATNP